MSTLPPKEFFDRELELANESQERTIAQHGAELNARFAAIRGGTKYKAEAEMPEDEDLEDEDDDFEDEDFEDDDDFEDEDDFEDDDEDFEDDDSEE